jgi:hypothetical protein
MLLDLLARLGIHRFAAKGGALVCEACPLIVDSLEAAQAFSRCAGPDRQAAARSDA